MLAPELVLMPRRNSCSEVVQQTVVAYHVSSQGQITKIICTFKTSFHRVHPLHPRGLRRTFGANGTRTVQKWHHSDMLWHVPHLQFRSAEIFDVLTSSLNPHSPDSHHLGGNAMRQVAECGYVREPGCCRQTQEVRRSVNVGVFKT